MENNTQARKWTLVINNPLEAGLDHAAIREILHAYLPACSLAYTLFHHQKPLPHGAY